MRKPDFIIVGAPKCGTSAMASYLRQNPGIFLPEREIHYFGEDLNRILPGGRPRWWRTGLTEREYLEFFSDASDDVVVGEKSAMYLYSKTAAFEIKKFIDDAKIIIMLRCPVDLMYSMHTMLVRMGIESEADFGRALELEEHGELSWQMSHDREPVRPQYKNIARLGEHAARMIGTFGRNNVHVILFDDLKRDPAAVYRDTLQFLGASDQFQPEFRVHNKGYRVRSPAVARLTRKTPPVIRGLVRTVVPKTVRDRLHSKLMKANRMRRAPDPMDSSLRKKLLAELAPDVERLARLINRDLSDWLP